MDSHSACNDSSFGPAVSETCRGGLDFTVTFEETILSILPTGVFIIIAGVHGAAYLGRNAVTKRSSVRLAKLAAISIYGLLQVALLVLRARQTPKRDVSLTSAALGLCSAIALAILSQLAHMRSPRPSFIIDAYIALSLLLDLPRVRTAWLLRYEDGVAAVLTASVVAKACVLVLEGTEKRRLLRDAYKHLSLEATSGLFGRSFFWWLNGLLVKGYRQILSIPDLAAIHEKIKAEAVTLQLSKEWQKRDARKKYNLVTCTAWTWRREALIVAVPRLFVVSLNIAQPFVIQSVVENISSSTQDDKNTENKGYALVAAVAMVYLGIAICTGFYKQLSLRLIAMMRGALVSLIYQKLTDAASRDSTAPSVMTLIETDVERICESWEFVVTDLWASVVQLGVAMWLLQRQIGAVCIAPVILTLLSTGLSLYRASSITSRQKTWLEAIDVRVNFTSHVLNHMKSVKMLGLSEKLRDMIHVLRMNEIEHSKRFRRVRSFYICLGNSPGMITQFITFVAYTIVARLSGNGPLSVSQVVASLSILSLLVNPLSELLFAVPQFFTALGCFSRVQEFLATDDWHDSRDQPARKGIPSDQEDRIVVDSAAIRWPSDSHPVLDDVSFRCTKDTPVTFVQGPVGCGKSTLLKALLGLPAVEGLVWVHSKAISYCAQSPWITSGKVRDSIVGENTFEQEWYDSVVYACALDVDLEQLAGGDMAAVGSKGISLSGGQKQRIALARALYARRPIALLDDVCSGLDASTRDAIMVRVFGPRGLLRKLGTTVILASSYLTRVEYADQLIVLDVDGRITEHGSPASLGHLGDSLGQPDTTETRTSPTSSSHVQQDAVTEDKAPSKDRQVGDFTVWKYYFRSLGVLSFLLFICFVVFDCGCQVAEYIWLVTWTNSGDSYQSGRTGYWLGVYAIFVVGAIVGLAISIYYVYIIVVPKSAKYLHWAVLQTTLNAPLTFISQTNTGTLLNRFSQDMRLIDMTLPGALVSTSFNFGGALGIGVLGIVAVPWFAIAMPFLLAALYVLQRFYLQTSRQLRLLDLESKSPLLAHFVETADGVSTIRAYGWSREFKYKAWRLLDACQKPFYLLLCIQQWLTLVLGIMVAVLATLLTALPMGLRGSNAGAGFVGVALVNLMGFGEQLARLLSNWTALETSLGAIARVKIFSEDTPQEEDPEGDVPKEWPSTGSLAFEGWSAKYADSDVLRHVDLEITHGQRIAICGRTGSGKSSLVSSILGLVPCSGGRIILDGVDISAVSSRQVRGRVTCVTQDPFLFTGSVRTNLDPLDTSSDAEMKSALQSVGLWAAINQGLSDAKALDQEMDKVSLSHGQSQLFCFARAVLRKSRLVILDEPTSSVDEATESQIYDIIESEMPQATVLMVTHRLARIRTFDQVVVMSDGQLLEQGPPSELLLDEKSALHKLHESQSSH